MRKLKLDLDTLEVTSFETEKERGERGTVDGHVVKAPSVDDPTCQYAATCDGGYTCGYYTCGGSCGGSCNNCGSGSANTACAMCLID